MNKKELKRNEKSKNKKSSKNLSNLISNIQPLISDHNGITLIALVITIIVMLILVGVTVTVALNGGLFNQAKVATADTQNAVNKEQNLSSGELKVNGVWYDSLEDYTNEIPSKKGNWELSVDGKTVTNGEVTLKVGDYVNYTQDEGTYPNEKLGYHYTGRNNAPNFATQLDMKWRILGVDSNGCLTLISDKPTTQGFVSDYGVGYCNIVFILNDICKELYSNKTLGLTARSLTMEDIEDTLDENKLTEIKTSWSGDKVKYGLTKTYPSGSYYPPIYAEENDSGIGVTEEQVATGMKTNGIGRSDSFYSEPLYFEEETYAGYEGPTEGPITCTQTYYDIKESQWESACLNELTFQMIANHDRSYFLASRCTWIYTDYAAFAVFGVQPRALTRYSFATTAHGVINGRPTLYVRPALSISRNYVVGACENDATGEDEAHMHTLSKVSSSGI